MSTAKQQKRVYLAGPDVFRPDAPSYGDTLKRRCSERGFVGVFPFDAVVPQSLSKPDRASWIYEQNTRLIQSCDCVAANVTPFRGISVDPGTAFEIGYAASRGMPIAGYSAVADSYLIRVRQRFQMIRSETGWRDEDGNAVEDFELEENLMIVIPLLAAPSGRRISPTINEALDTLRTHFQ